MEEKTNGNITVTELFLDANGKECKREEAVKVYVQIRDGDGKYVDGRMIPLK